MAQPVINVRVAPSGQAIAVECFAADGVTSAPITGFAGLDELQSLTVSGQPSAQAVALTYGGATTGPIPYRRVPPSSAFSYHLAVTGTYDVQVCSGYGAGVANHQVYDGILPLGQAVTIDSSTMPAGTYTDPNGAVFRPVGRYTFATSATVDIFAALGATYTVSAIRFVPTNGGAAVIQIMSDPANTATSGDHAASVPISATYANGSGIYGAGFEYSGSVTAYGTLQPSFWYLAVADVQAAIGALPGFSGGVTASSSFSPPVLGGLTSQAPQIINLAFGGPKANLGIGQPTSSDPGMTPAVTHPGGQPPRIRINGAAPITLVPDAWSPGQSWFLGILPQADVYPGTAGGVYVMTADGYGFRAGGALSGVGAGGIPFTGYAKLLRYGFGGNNPDVFPFESLPAGTYTLEATWPVLAWPNAGGITGSAKAATLAVVDGSGAVLHSEVADQSVAPAGVADPARSGVSWHSLGSYTVASGGTLQVQIFNRQADGGLSIADAVRLTRTSADASVRIAPTDAVTLDAPAGWLATSAGPAPASAAQVLGHASGSLMPDPALVTPTMPAGWNACGEDSGGANLWHCNLARRINYPGTPGVAAVDATLHPTSLTAAGGGQWFAFLSQLSGEGESNGPGVPALPNTPAGVWSIWYDDASGGSSPPLVLHTGSSPFPEVSLPTTVKGQATGNRVYYNNVYDPRASSATVGLLGFKSGPARADGTFPCSYQNIHVYPPDPATGGPWLNPPIWHPATVARLAGGPIRALDLTGAAASNIGGVEDVATQAELTLYGSPSVAISIATIAPDPAPDGYFNPAIGPILKVTTATPHGFRDMDAIGLAMTDGSAFPTPTFTQNGQPFAAGTNFQGYNHYIHVTGTTTFDFVVEFNKGLIPGFAPATMTNTLTDPRMIATKGTGRGTPYEDIAALAIQANCPAIHVPIPIQATPALLDHVAACLLATPPGTMIRAEISNEPWNFTQTEWARCCYLSHALGLSPGGDEWVPGYCATAAAGHARLAAAFAAAGRSADLVRVFGAQQADPSTTAAIAGFCAAKGYPVDEIAIGPYLEGDPGGSPDAGQPARFNLYTVAQGLDLLELVTEYGPARTTWADHRAAIGQAGLKRPDGSPVRLIAYEGGLESVIPYGSGQPRGMLRTIATMADVRMYRLSRRILELAQLGGCSAWQEYRLGLKWEGVTWDKVVGTLRGPGTGDPTQDTANVAPFADKLGLRSQFAGAFHAWTASMAPKPLPNNPIPFHYFFQSAGGF